MNQSFSSVFVKNRTSSMHGLLRRLPVLVTLACLWPGGEADAQSLWNQRKDPNRSVYEDTAPIDKGYKEGDLITIQVIEQTNARNTSNLRAQRESTLEVGLDQFLRFNRDNKLVPAARDGLDIDFSTNKEINGRGQLSKESGLQATITARVVEVLSNKHLLVEARKSIDVDGNREILLLTGFVNPEHIDKTKDTIRSERIYDAKIQRIESGPVAATSRQGWLANLWDRLWPW